MAKPLPEGHIKDYDLAREWGMMPAHLRGMIKELRKELVKDFLPEMPSTSIYANRYFYEDKSYRGAKSMVVTPEGRGYLMEKLAEGLDIPSQEEEVNAYLIRELWEIYKVTYSYGAGAQVLNTRLSNARKLIEALAQRLGFDEEGVERVAESYFCYQEHNDGMVLRPTERGIAFCGFEKKQEKPPELPKGWVTAKMLAGVFNWDHKGVKRRMGELREALIETHTERIMALGAPEEKARISAEQYVEEHCVGMRSPARGQATLAIYPSLIGEVKSSRSKVTKEDLRKYIQSKILELVKEVPSLGRW